MVETDDPPRAALIAALLISIAAVLAVLAAAVSHQRRIPPVAVAAVPAPHATDAVCTALLAALPAHLGDYRRATVATPVPDGVAAWAGHGDEPVVLRCGLDRPADFTVGSAIQEVDGVAWFAARTDDRTTWYAVDRPVYLALTLPAGSGPAPIQQLSASIAATVPVEPINPAPPPPAG